MNFNLIPGVLALPGVGRAIADVAPVAIAQVSIALSAAMLILARHRSGRVLLHCCAMVGDREVRFHCAGIVREMPWH
jgi:hypothetical protein